ncbi:hypothetical protein KFE25_002920 [Diacronema lutheri]|uniref:Telomerase Cajal body protein 1 n=1 Tax=Diacronema lutheri TaxID=2081491 RepID=A0A8J5XJ98_DIALT|nr:hypothetical protein KFE25_002920 [Diacronema lutheri]
MAGAECTWELDLSVTSHLCGAELPECVKGLKWAPDGTCFLTACDDNRLRLYELPAHALGGGDESADAGDAAPLAPAVSARESETIYDYCWYPGMRSTDPATCCFASTSRDQPVHLWDAFTGALRASYCAHDGADQLTAARSLAFSVDGTRLLCGFERAVCVFDTARPGRPLETRATVPSRRRAREGQRGILSTIAVDGSGSGLYAVGSYAGSTGVYAEAGGELVCLLGGHTAGVTHVAFSADGRTLVTGARQDGRLLCWDVRHTARAYRACERAAPSNQRILFSLDNTSRWLVSGSQDGRVLAFDLRAEQTEPPTCVLHVGDAVNAAMLHPWLPILGIAIGERERAPLAFDDTSGSDADGERPGSAVAAGLLAGGGAPERAPPRRHEVRIRKTGWAITAADARAPAGHADGWRSAAAVTDSCGEGRAEACVA